MTRSKERLGRDPACDLVITAPSVAPVHAELQLRGGVWWLRDLGSEAGTWVDGERVIGAAPLAPGSILRLGQAELVFSPQDTWADSAVSDSELPPFQMSVAWEPRDEPMAPEFAWPLRASWSHWGWYLGITVVIVALIVSLIVWGG